MNEKDFNRSNFFKGAAMNLESNRRKLSDDDKMPFGKWQGRRLGDVPDNYWRWFLLQGWAEKYPDLLEYAQVIEED